MFSFKGVFMNKRNLIKIAVAIAIVALFVLMLGSSMGRKLTEGVTSDVVINKLEDKYGQSFELKSVQIENVGNDTSMNRYKMTVVPVGSDESFEVNASMNGDEICDFYEKILYKDDIEKEVNSYYNDETDWAITDIEYAFTGNKETAYDSMKDYVSDGNVLVSVNAQITSENPDIDAITESVYEYVNKFYESGYQISVNFESDSRSRIVRIEKGDEMLSTSDLEKIMYGVLHETA